MPFRGPALLVSNHMSHVDGFLIGACVQRFIRFMVWKPYYDLKALNWFFRQTQRDSGRRRTRRECGRFSAARRELAAGHVVCIFAEGAISRTGNILPFKRGMEKIVRRQRTCPIIPVHLDRLWGSIFSFERGRFFWKWPKHIPYPVTVSFGNPMPATSTAHEVRQAIQELAAEATAHRQTAARYAAAPLDPQRAPQLEPLRHGRFHRPRADLRAHAHRRPAGGQLGAHAPRRRK